MAVWEQEQNDDLHKRLKGRGKWKNPKKKRNKRSIQKKEKNNKKKSSILLNTTTTTTVATSGKDKLFFLVLLPPPSPFSTLYETKRNEALCAYWPIVIACPTLDHDMKNRHSASSFSALDGGNDGGGRRHSLARLKRKAHSINPHSFGVATDQFKALLLLPTRTQTSRQTDTWAIGNRNSSLKKEGKKK